MSEITATQFKARCLRLLDTVADTGQPLVITKHGKPVARLVPIEEEDDLRGSVTYHATDEELIASSMGAWDSERD